MFGETPIFGSKELSLDNKNRISLPFGINIKTGEELGILLDVDYETIYIMSAANLNSFRETLFARYEIKDYDILNQEQTRIARKFFYGSCFVKAQCQNRVILPGHFIENLQFGNRILAIGENDRLALCKDLDTYLLNDKTKRSL